MPRANRSMLPGRICHLTHRCHDRKFLLASHELRDRYRALLVESRKKFKVTCYGYCITRNHVHLIVDAAEPDRVSLFMQKAQGEIAQGFNKKEDRSGAFWSDRFHCTLVEDGAHFLNCLKYVDLNMVRAGEIPHPREWKWCGYYDLVHPRKRYMLVDTDQVAEKAGHSAVSSFKESYMAGIEDRLSRKAQDREPCWTETYAVGSKAFLEVVSKSYDWRSNWLAEAVPSDRETWSLRDNTLPYRVEKSRSASV